MNCLMCRPKRKKNRPLKTPFYFASSKYQSSSRRKLGFNKKSLKKLRMTLLSIRRKPQVKLTKSSTIKKRTMTTRSSTKCSSTHRTLKRLLKNKKLIILQSLCSTEKNYWSILQSQPSSRYNNLLHRRQFKRMSRRRASARNTNVMHIPAKENQNKTKMTVQFTRQRKSNQKLKLALTKSCAKKNRTS